MLDQYEVLSELSGGTCSRIDLVKDKVSAEQWACKSVSTHGLHAESLKLLKAEVRFLRDLNHPNIMRLHDHVEDTEAGKFITILEYIPGTDCSLFMEKNKGPLDEHVVAVIIKQVLSALSHCH